MFFRCICPVVSKTLAISDGRYAEMCKHNIFKDIVCPAFFEVFRKRKEVERSIFDGILESSKNDPTLLDHVWNP